MNLALAKTLIYRQPPGAAVLEARDGSEDVALTRSRRVDLALMDVQMTGMDGLEATRLIRDEEAASGHRAPIIALTAGAPKEEKDRAIAAGMDDFLAKPIDKAKLRSALERLADRLPALSLREEETAAALEREACLEALGGDEAMLRKPAALCLETRPGQVEELKAALDRGEIAAAARAAHAINGAAQSMRLPRLAALAAGLRAGGTRSDPTTWPAASRGL